MTKKPTIPESYIYIETPDELHEAIADELFIYKVEDYPTRLAIASLSTIRRLNETHNIDIETAKEIAGCDLRAFLAATAICYSEEELSDIDGASKNAHDSMAARLKEKRSIMLYLYNE